MFETLEKLAYKHWYVLLRLKHYFCCFCTADKMIFASNSCCNVCDVCNVSVPFVFPPGYTLVTSYFILKVNSSCGFLWFYFPRFFFSLLLLFSWSRLHVPFHVRENSGCWCPNLLRLKAVVIKMFLFKNVGKVWNHLQSVAIFKTTLVRQDVNKQGCT